MTKNTEKVDELSTLMDEEDAAANAPAPANPPEPEAPASPGEFPKTMETGDEFKLKCPDPTAQQPELKPGEMSKEELERAKQQAEQQQQQAFYTQQVMNLSTPGVYHYETLLRLDTQNDLLAKQNELMEKHNKVLEKVLKNVSMDEDDE